MGKQNDAFTAYLGRAEVLADLYNGCLYQGEKVVQAGNLCEVQQFYQQGLSERVKSPTARRRERDAIRAFWNEKSYVLLAAEAQNQPHLTMPFRCMEYDLAEYARQLRYIRLKSEGKLKTGVEYLNRISRMDVATYDKYEEKLKWNNSYLKKLERSAENENFTNSFLAEILFEYTTGTPAELLYEYVINAGLLDVRSNLSNGDTVTWEWSISEDSQKEMEKMLDCKLIFSDQEFKVQGLEKADTVDPFSILQVEYEGISPNGSAYLQSNAKDEFESKIQFETDRSNGLSNGDILTVSVNDDNADYLLSNYGKILSPLQKEYTVEGLDEYVGSWNELTDDFKAMLKTESEDKIYAYTASEYAKSSLLSNLSYKGYIFSALKNGEESSGEYNSVDIDLNCIDKSVGLLKAGKKLQKEHTIFKAFSKEAQEKTMKELVEKGVSEDFKKNFLKKYSNKIKGKFTESFLSSKMVDCSNAFIDALYECGSIDFGGYAAYSQEFKDALYSNAEDGVLHRN